MRLSEIRSNNIRSRMAGSALQMILYHGGSAEISKFKRGPQGVFFSPHREWAEHYGPVITEVYVWAPKVYLATGDDEFSDAVLDSLFDRDYDTLAGQIKELQNAGYHALQTQTDSEMVCAFSNAKLFSAKTGNEM